MNTPPRTEQFIDLVRDPAIFNLSKEIITESYLECAPGCETAMADLLEQTFAHLERGCVDEKTFASQIEKLVSHVFRKQDPDFWFNRIYKQYKREIKPARRAQHLQAWLSGPRVLDFGCGDGLLSALLAQRGCQVFLTDVLDYRDPAASGYPFEPMPGPTAVPFAGESFDSALVMAVLHHVDAASLPLLLDTLRQRCRQVIVEEDCADVPETAAGYAEVCQTDPQFCRFAALSVPDQFRMLMFIDYFANAIAQGIPEMEMPFNFRTVAGWHSLFEARGFHVRQTRLLGFQKGNFNRSCHVWFQLDAGIPTEAG